MEYSITLSPVSRNQSAVIKLLYRKFGPGSEVKKKVEELTKNGGTILDNLNKEAATNFAKQLRELGAQVEVKEMEEGESSPFEIRLVDAGESKLAVVKVIKEITGHGLNDSKELVDNLGVVAANISKVTAEKMKKKLEAKGAKVEIRQISISEPSPVENNERDQRKNSDSLNDLKIIFDGNKTTVVIETHSGHKLQISEKNNSLLLEDHNGNKIRLSQEGVLVL